jgi:hypothetical protein
MSLLNTEVSFKKNFFSTGEIWRYIWDSLLKNRNFMEQYQENSGTLVYKYIEWLKSGYLVAR